MKRNEVNRRDKIQDNNNDIILIIIVIKEKRGDCDYSREEGFRVKGQKRGKRQSKKGIRVKRDIR